MQVLSYHYNAGSLYVGYTDGLHEFAEIIEDELLQSLLKEAGLIRGVVGMWVLVDVKIKNRPKWFHYPAFIREKLDDTMVKTILNLFLTKKTFEHAAI